MPVLQLLRKPKTPVILLIGLIALYALYFSWYTINRHDTLNSYAADLSLIDQPMWNTVLGPGGFMEQTWGDRQQPRLAEHFEPILVPLALLFFIWDDVRILLIAQSVALALGALPVFWIARTQFIAPPYFEGERADYRSPLPHWAALAFAVAYLLYPHLQAANIADFHADPFVVTPLLFAFWYASRKRWGWMWLWAFIAMSTKETLPTLTAMLGVWLLIKTYRLTKPATGEAPGRWSALIAATDAKQGLALIGISTIWFLVTTFLIVAPLAQQYFGTDGPIYLANRYAGQLNLTDILQEPARWQYLIGLFAAVGFLPLLAPELLVLGLPVLLANFFSSFPGQYSGEQHYSAPLVVAFIIAAIYGTRRIIERTSLHEINRQPLRMATLIGATLWILAWSLSYHALHGWTPLSVRMESYRMGPVASQLDDFIDSIPAEAVVSASAAIHPHLAHRRVVYLFPTVEEADYLLVDVTDIPGVHPNDARTKLLDLLQNEWRLLKADHGLLLAHRAPTEEATVLPNAFFDFARAETAPQQPTALAFGDGRLRLLGYDVKDDPDDGVTFRFYWRTSDSLPEDVRLWPFIYDDTGQLISNPTRTPMIAATWYPPHRWQPGEVIVTETLPQLMPDTFHLGLAVGPEGSFANPDRRYPVQELDGSARATTLDISRVADPATRLQPGNWAQLATFQRQGPFLDHLPATPRLQAFTPVNVKLGSAIYLTGFWLNEQTLEPGTNLPLVLRWMAESQPQTDLTVFVHLLAPDGTLVAQSDGYPTWLTPTPTSQWSANQPILDRHLLTLPNDLPAGLYTLQLGLYQAQTLERLRLPGGDDAWPVSQIRIE